MADLNLTEDQLTQILPGNTHISEWYAALVNVLPEYEITTPQRVAAFLAQCAHESNGFTAIRENLNYKWESLRRVFPKYFPTDELAQQYAHNQEKIANRVYANRMGNGDEASGDGYKWCGKGLIQLTGFNNHSKFAESLGIDVEDVIPYLGTFEGAVKSACWFWDTNHLNELADAGDVMSLTKKINGGTIGLEDRQNRYDSALKILTGDA